MVWVMQDLDTIRAVGVFMTWKSNYLRISEWDVLINPCLNYRVFYANDIAHMSNYIPKNKGLIYSSMHKSLKWRRNGREGGSNHQPYCCLLNNSFRRRSKKTSKLRVTCLCAGNSPVTGEFPAQMSSNAENVFISWRHHTSVEICQ